MSRVYVDLTGVYFYLLMHLCFFFLRFFFSHPPPVWLCEVEHNLSFSKKN